MILQMVLRATPKDFGNISNLAIGYTLALLETSVTQMAIQLVILRRNLIYLMTIFAVFLLMNLPTLLCQTLICLMVYLLYQYQHHY